MPHSRRAIPAVIAATGFEILERLQKNAQIIWKQGQSIDIILR